MSPSPAHKPPDIELGHVRDGYPALATWISRDPDSETFVFRKFRRLAARNILHLQCKLIALEKEIDDIDEEARQSSDLEARQASRRYETLISYSEDDSRPEKKRLEKLREVKILLEEYYSTLLQQSQITALSPPTPRVISTFSAYLSGNIIQSTDPNAPTSLPLLAGRAKDFLSDENDLVALRPPPESDYLSRLLQDNWKTIQRLNPKTNTSSDPIDQTTIYKNRHIMRTVATVGMLIAATLLIVAIMSLYVVKDEKVKLGLVAIYTLLFALSVALLTSARRAEVFAATAAYAAVLVVFVSGDLGGSRGGWEQCLVQLEGGIFKVVRCPE